VHECAVLGKCCSSGILCCAPPVQLSRKTVSRFWKRILLTECMAEIDLTPASLF